MEQILHQLSKAVHAAIDGTEAQREFIPRVLHDLIRLEIRPVCLTKIAYDWCSTIYENRQILGDWKGLLLASLEIGFRHLDPRNYYTAPPFTHTEHHPEMVDAVFNSQKSEAIADLLHAWTMGYSLHVPPGTCTERLICLQNSVQFSPRLRLLVIRSVELIGYGGFEGVGVERLVGLLDNLSVTFEDTVNQSEWLWLLLETLRTSEGSLRLSDWYWELPVELAVSCSLPSGHETIYNPQITKLLAEAQEWSKLEHWIGAVWILWPPEAGGIMEEDLGHLTPLLFRQRPGAFQKFEQWMERWSQRHGENIPESFQRICKQAQEVAQRDTP